MSQVLALLLLSPSEIQAAEGDLARAAARSMSRFQSQPLLDPSQRVPCPCVGRRAREQGEVHAQRLVGSWEDRRAEFLFGAPGKAPASAHMSWEAFIAPFRQRFQELSLQAAQSHPEHQAADPRCSSCQGEGTYLLSRSPLDRLDDWAIGGAWAGLLQEQGVPCALEGNACLAVHFPRDVAPFVLVTPSGEWLQRHSARIHALPEASSSSEVWLGEIHALLSRHEEDWAVLCDVRLREPSP